MNPQNPNNSEAVLILSEQLDYHGVAVRWGLEQMGVAYTWWERGEFPRSQRLSAWVAEGQTRFESSGSDVSLSRGRYRAIWNRRGQIPQVDDSLNRSDKIVAKNESAYVLDSLGQMLAAANPDALIVNPFCQAKAANPKLQQLAIARDLGFRVPSTLVSNDPEQIRAFFEDHRRAVVAKQHIPFALAHEQGRTADLRNNRARAQTSGRRCGACRVAHDLPGTSTDSQRNPPDRFRPLDLRDEPGPRSTREARRLCRHPLRECRPARVHGRRKTRRTLPRLHGRRPA